MGYKYEIYRCYSYWGTLAIRSGYIVNGIVTMSLKYTQTNKKIAQDRYPIFVCDTPNGNNPKIMKCKW